MTAPRRLALPLAVLAWCALVIAALVLAIGPLAVPAIGLSISHASRLLGASAVLALAALWCSRGPGVLLDDLARSRTPYTATLLLLLGASGALLSSHGAVNVGGADSAGYLAQAQRWREGRLHQALPLPVPDLRDPWAQASLGTRPDASGTATVPTYPPGLPWLQAVALALGGETTAVRVLPAVAAMVALLAAWALVLPHAGPAGALLVVTCLATLPPFLFQALQPMSDVPALAAWLGAMALAARATTPTRAGAAAATMVAILVRPNLTPLVLPVLWQASLSGSARVARRGPLVILAAAVVAVLIVASVQASLYGSPLQSGYGRASELFSPTYVAENVRLYAAWLREAVPVFTRGLLAAGGLCLIWHSWRQPTWRPLSAMAVLTMALYAVYVPFDSWTYLRFVLLALAVAPVGVAVWIGRLQASRHARWTFPVTAALLLAVALPNLQLARALSVFTVRASEYRYLAAGRFVRDHLPADTVILAGQHSASAPYYSGRPVVRVDLLTPQDLAVVVSWATRAERPLALVLDEAEPAALRERLGREGLLALDWPPRAEISRPVATRIWVDADRSTYLAGGQIRTTRLTDIPRR
ncbi:glycosyltransferase family 39 protein [Luteitalea sp.]